MIRRVSVLLVLERGFMMIEMCGIKRTKWMKTKWVDDRENKIQMNEFEICVWIDKIIN